MTAPRIKIVDVALFERPVDLRLPFKFGADSVTSAVQAFARVEIETENGVRAVGASAELMVPKWFDKRSYLSQADNTDQLRLSLLVAASALSGRGLATAFDHAINVYENVSDSFDPADIPPLAAGFGPALLEKAVIDALCHALGLSFQDAVKSNALGIVAERAAQDLAGFDLDGFLGALSPLDEVHVRHTIGGLDPLTAGDGLDDGLPVTAEDIIATYGVRYFKIKLSGDPAADLQRCSEISRHLNTQISESYVVTLDANEQYPSVAALENFLKGLATPQLQKFRNAVLYVEQPFHRDVAFDVDLNDFKDVPIIIDESDATFDAFLRAKHCGYRGVSSKSCKGVYRAILNAARAHHWTAEGEGNYFIAGEDLTCQAGLAVQQDLALLSLLGIQHSERNGHHFATGMPGAPMGEVDDFLKAHSDMYEQFSGSLRLMIGQGKIRIGSLFAPGYASGAHPQFETMKPMIRPIKESYHG